MTHGPVSPAYMNFSLYGPAALFTSMSLTSVTVSCMTCGPASPAAYTNFLLCGPALLSHLVYNLWACSTLYIKPHIHLTSISHTTHRPALPLYMFLFI